MASFLSLNTAIVATLLAACAALGCGTLLVLFVLDPRRPLDPIRAQRDLDVHVRAAMRQRKPDLRTRLWKAVRRRLDVSGHDDWSPRGFGVIGLACAAAAGIAGWYAFGAAALALLYAGLGGVAPWIWLGQQAERRAITHTTQVAQLIVVIAGAVSTGQSLQYIMTDVLPRTVGPPLSQTVLRVTRRLDPARGIATVTFADVLADLDARLHSPAFSLARLAIEEATAGGAVQLAQSLEMIAGLAREDIVFRNEVRAQFTLIRGTATLVFAFPILFTLVLRLIEPSMVVNAYSTPLGWAVAGAVAAASIGAYLVVTASERRAARDLLETYE